jgi:thiol-disulfide isomerase/thioredoxin
MSKAQRIRQQNAREKIAAQRAAERKAQVRRQTLMAGGSVLAVLAVVAVLIIVKLSSGGSSGPSSTGTSQPAAVSAVTSVPASTTDSVGKGTANPKMLIPLSGAPALASGGKPEVLYMGAEYCPFCATERWAMLNALSRFGTFSNIKFIHSAADDTPASVPTLTFYKSGYNSKYVAFTPVEMQKIDRSNLQTPTSEQKALLNKYDAPPYVQGAGGSIPFMDFGGKYIVSGASYDYNVLSGKTYAQIAAAMKDPTSDIAKGAIGAANQMTAAICKMTGDQPATACTTSIKALEAGL